MHCKSLWIKASAKYIYVNVSEKLLSASCLTGPLSFFIWSELDKAKANKKQQMPGVWKSNRSLALPVIKSENKGENKIAVDERVFFFMYTFI